MQPTKDQDAAIAEIGKLAEFFDDLLEEAWSYVDGDVVLVREEVRRLTQEVRTLTRDNERLLDRVDHYVQQTRYWEDRYIAMRQEPNEAMNQWFEYMMGQLDFEIHLESHYDQKRREVRAAAVHQRKQMAQRMAEIIEVWRLRNGVEAEGLGEAKGSDS